MTATIPTYISRKQAAAHYSCSVQTIDKLVKTGQLPAMHLGRAVRIKVADLEALTGSKRRVH